MLQGVTQGALRCLCSEAAARLLRPDSSEQVELKREWEDLVVFAKGVNAKSRRSGLENLFQGHNSLKLRLLPGAGHQRARNGPGVEKGVGGSDSVC
jgi:hypothetical protein